MWISKAKWEDLKEKINKYYYYDPQWKIEILQKEVDILRKEIALIHNALKTLGLERYTQDPATYYRKIQQQDKEK